MERFAFGKNWQNFIEQLTPESYLSAKCSMQELVGDLNGKSFLDIGCGSGLFSVAASALGAKRVVAFDVDPECVSTAKNLLKNIRQWDPQIREDVVEFSIDSILNENLAVGPFDVVYSWGVLHHTGDMYRAFDVVGRLVAKRGRNPFRKDRGMNYYTDIVDWVVIHMSMPRQPRLHGFSMTGALD